MTRAVHEYLTDLEETNPAETTPKNISLADPAAHWTAATGEPAFYAYLTNYQIDPKASIIVDAEATPAYRTDEVNSTKTMVGRVEDWFDIKPERLMGDTAYGTAPMPDWMVNDKWSFST